jgi:hypothetical protein
MRMLLELTPSGSGLEGEEEFNDPELTSVQDEGGLAPDE